MNITPKKQFQGMEHLRKQVRSNEGQKLAVTPAHEAALIRKELVIASVYFLVIIVIMVGVFIADRQFGVIESLSDEFFSSL